MELERYRCLACGMPHHSETDFFPCTNCCNWSHEHVHPAPPPAPGAESIADKRAGIRLKVYTCPHCGLLSQQEVLKAWWCKHCHTRVPPHPNDIARAAESPSLYAQRVGRASRYPEGDMTLPGYDLKEARKGREDRRATALVLGCIAVLLSTASIVMAHDFSEVIWRLASVAAGVTWAHCLLALDKR